MKTLFLCLFTVFCIVVSAQTGTESLKEESFLLRGKVRNASVLSLAVCHPVYNRVFDIAVPENGVFEERLPVVGCEDVYLYLNPTVTCMVFPGDTIDMEYDGITGSYKLSGTTPARTREFQLDILLDRTMKEKFREIEGFYYGLEGKYFGQYPTSDTLLDQAREYLNACWKVISDFELQEGELPHKKQFIARSLYSVALIFAGDPRAYDALFDWLGERWGEDMLDEMVYYGDCFNPFMHTRVREFYVQAVRFWCWKGIWELTPVNTMKVAQALIPHRELFETFCMSMFYQEGYILRTSLSRLAPDWLAGQIRNPYYRRELKRMSRELSGFPKKGDNAPDFTLKGSEGKNVSLHDFKGKYVYLDFWNTGCAPCIGELPVINRLMEDNPDWKEKLAVVSVCVGLDEAGWKNLLQKHQPAGTSLYVSHEKDKRIEPYKITAYPHYMLISPEGKIISTNFLRPSVLIDHRPKDMNYLGAFIRGAEEEE